ncbi:MAG: Dabb family protein [Balneolaceae bacterium]
MVKHIVLWKLKEAAGGKTKAENASIIKELLERLPAKIQALKSAEVGINILPEDNDMVCDVVLTAICETQEDVEVYAVHPEHQKVVSFIKKVVSERRVIDYQY